MGLTGSPECVFLRVRGVKFIERVGAVIQAHSRCLSNACVI